MIYNELFEIFGNDYFENVRMDKYTTFKTGGPAKVMLIIRNENDFIKGLYCTRSLGLKHYVLAGCSNVLVSDNGFDGAVFMISSDFSGYTVNNEIIEAKAGISLAKLSLVARDNSLSGLEFACGIPGTLGAAVAINAGAYGGEMKDIVIDTRYIDTDLSIKILENNDHAFGHRCSAFCYSEKYVLSTRLRLSSGDKEIINGTMQRLKGERRLKQPLELPSAGSVFKRPEGYYAGKLIHDAGLKGYKIGGAQVSQLHAGFIVNTGGATSKDIYSLIDHIKNTVRDSFGVELENEVKLLGEF